MSESNPERQIYTPPMNPPGPIPGLGELCREWGEEGIRDLVSRFYDRIPDSKIGKMFPENLDLAKQKQADFIIQVTGGKPHYSQNYGPPRMRMRHFPFVIDEEARLEWIRCYMEALDESVFSEDSKRIFSSFLESFSKWMVNSI
ncbi:bacitracin resistance protein BacA [Leptospira kobayashii]|uniref:Bacitracin resistance protein BacA n=1 Tax=Leptospira kobayashii TaxID=1917830 RepID=A0ABN6KHR8_9LEPT|nr:bacitracin resistance protein BacA [Leptospira kobayashii]BDA79592.1 bacitracin resistance protein BacA [Leptospira kobayashii]